jgi:catechol 2,3-dioxygenase-like lactoylglutathione lyase family enzyme
MNNIGKSPFSKIAYICLYVSNIRESIGFYRDVLELEPLSPNVDISSVGFYAFKTGDTLLALEPNGFKKSSEKTKAENPYLLQFRADSPDELERMNQQLEAKGVILNIRSEKTSYGLITNFIDPDGNKLEIICTTCK